MGRGMTTFYTVPEVARMFRVCEETVRRRVRKKTWPAWRDGVQIRFGPEDIDAIRNLGQQHPAPSREDRRARNKKIRNTQIFAQ